METTKNIENLILMHEKWKKENPKCCVQSAIYGDFKVHTIDGAIKYLKSKLYN